MNNISHIYNDEFQIKILLLKITSIVEVNHCQPGRSFPTTIWAMTPSINLKIIYLVFIF
jgi:hypothetical protein